MESRGVIIRYDSRLTSVQRVDFAGAASKYPTGSSQSGNDWGFE